MKRRGSALAYVIIVVFSITSVIIVSARLASATDQAYSNQYARARFDSMADGVVAQAISDCYRGTIATGNRTTNYDGAPSLLQRPPAPNTAEATT